MDVRVGTRWLQSPEETVIDVPCGFLRFLIAAKTANRHNTRMFPVLSTDLLQLLLQLLAGTILIAGATTVLCLGLLIQNRRLVPSLSQSASVSRTLFTAFHVRLTLLVTLLFSVAALFHPMQAEPHKSGTMVTGPLFYAFTGLLLIGLCLIHLRTTFRQTFIPSGCPHFLALKKGLVYGLAVIPPMMLAMTAMNALSASLGYEPQKQDIFDWLSDPALPPAVRLFLLGAVVLIAPVMEELLFRGILFTAVLKTRPFLFSALLTSTYFALIHFNAPSFIPLLALSVAFSAGYAATGSILTPIAMHVLFNLSGVLFYFAENL